MGWKFWKTKDESAKKKTSKPKELPSCVGRYLIVKMKQDPDQVWGLKCVTNQREDKNEFDFHIFDESQTGHIGALDFDSLTTHPDCILYSGWYNKTSNTVNMNLAKGN